MHSDLFNTNKWGNVYCDEGRLGEWTLKSDVCPVCGEGQIDQDDPEWISGDEIEVTHRCDNGHEWHEVFKLDRVYFVRPKPIYQVVVGDGTDECQEVIEEASDLDEAKLGFKATMDSIMNNGMAWTVVAINRVDPVAPLETATHTVARFEYEH